MVPAWLAIHLYRHLAVQDSDDSFDYADLNVLLLQYCALFNMQFNVGADAARLPYRFCEPVGIPAEELDAVTYDLPTLRNRVEPRRIRPTRDGGTAQHHAFFVLEDDHL